MTSSIPMEDAKPVHAPCGAKTRSGTPCANAPVIGSTRCRMHGGATPRGAASPHFKTGRYSRHLPTRLAARYAEAVEDPELLSIRDDVALLDARLADVLQRVDSGESGARWRAVQSAWWDVAGLRQCGDTEGQERALLELEQHITAGVTDYAAWQEVRSLLDQRARLAGAEWRREVVLNQTITAEQAMAISDALRSAVMRHVHDRATLQAIGAEFERIFNLEHGQRLN